MLGRKRVFGTFEYMRLRGDVQHVTGIRLVTSRTVWSYFVRDRRYKLDSLEPATWYDLSIRKHTRSKTEYRMSVAKSVQYWINQSRELSCSN